MMMTPGGIGGPSKNQKSKIQETDESTSKSQGKNPLGTRFITWMKEVENSFTLAWKKFFQESPQKPIETDTPPQVISPELRSSNKKSLEQGKFPSTLATVNQTGEEQNAFLKSSQKEENAQKTIETDKPRQIISPEIQPSGDKKSHEQGEFPGTLTNVDQTREKQPSTKRQPRPSKESSREQDIRDMLEMVGINDLEEQNKFLKKHSLLGKGFAQALTEAAWANPENQKESREISIRDMLANAGQTPEEQNAFLERTPVSSKEDYKKALKAAGEIIKKNKNARKQEIQTILTARGITDLERQVEFLKENPIVSKEQFEATKKRATELEVTESLALVTARKKMNELQIQLNKAREFKFTPENMGTGKRAQELALQSDLSKQLEEARKKLDDLIKNSK